MSTKPDLLVTGASGLLGSALARAARRLGLSVTGTYHEHALDLAVPMVQADLADADGLRALAERLQPRWIAHCAAWTSVDGCEQDPARARRLNVDATAALASAGGRLAYVSTDSVFDGKRGGYTEEDAPAPLNVYARTKLDGEKAAGGGALVVRTNLFGWSPRGASLAEWVLRELRAGRPITGFHDVRFAPLLADDLAELLLELMRRGERGLLHLGAAAPVSKLEFARLLAQAFGLDASLIRPGSVDAAPLKAPRPKDTSLDSRKAQALLGRALPAVAEGIRRMKERRGENAHAEV